MDKHSEITLPGGGSTVLHLTAASGDSTPVALVLPAMGVPAGYYGPFVDDLARHGVSAAVADYPGQGEARPLVDREHDHGYSDIADEWLPAVVAALRTEHDGPLVAIGHSLGGHVALAHLAGDAPLLDGLVLVASGSTHWRVQQGLKTLTQTQFMAALTRVMGVWRGDKLGFGGVQARTLIREWAAFARTGTLAPQGRPVDERLHGRDLPVLAIDLDGDELAPPAAVEALAGLLVDAPVERWTFAKGPDDPGRPVSHQSFARSPEIIGEHIADWVRAHVGAEADRRA